MNTPVLWAWLGVCGALSALLAALGAKVSPAVSALCAGGGAALWGVFWLRFVRQRFSRWDNLLSNLQQREFADSLSGTTGSGATLRVEALQKAIETEHAERDQKEQLLRAVVEAAPMAIVVYSDLGRILYSNAEARRVFFEGQALEGHNFLQLLERAPEPMRHGLLSDTDTMFSVDDAGERGTYHLAKRNFQVGAERQTLLMVKPLSDELGRQEVEVWKRVIRIINHELNNSLAPISSMVHSARLIAKNPEQLPKLSRVFDIIEERAGHLVAFLEGYARFARLPKPHPTDVAWERFLEGLSGLFPNVQVLPPPPGNGYFDAGQLQQALINLLKNAEESGGPSGSVELSVTNEADGASTIEVRDRGNGMTDDVLKNALVPFFTTKEKGTGLGLPLCREIVEAHGGRLRVSRREGGGIVVNCLLPGRRGLPASRTARLSLTRG